MRKQLIILKIAKEAMTLHENKREAEQAKLDYYQSLGEWRWNNGYGEIEQICFITCNDQIKSDGRWTEMLESADEEFDLYKKSKQAIKNTERRLDTAFRNAEKEVLTL